MKKSKWILFALVLGIILILHGDQFQNYLRVEFASPFCSISLHPKDTTVENFAEAIRERAKDANVSVFFARSQSLSLFEESLDFYTADEPAHKLIEKRGISARSYPSVFAGKTTVRFHDISEATKLDVLRYVYIAGDQESAAQFRKSLIEICEVEQLNAGYKDDHYFKQFLLFLGLLGVFLLLLTSYDVSLQKKELLLRVFLGESKVKLLWRNIVIDTAIMTGIFVAMRVALSPLTNLQFEQHAMWIAFGGLILLNALCYISFLWMSPRKVFAPNIGNDSLLTASYAVKFVTTLLVVGSISASAYLFSDAADIHKQDFFFESQKESQMFETNFSMGNAEMSDVDTFLSMLDKSSTFNEKLYQAYPSDVVLLANWYLGDDKWEKQGVTAILCNRGATPYLERQFPSLMQDVPQDRMTIFVPQKYASVLGEFSLPAQDFNPFLVDIPVETVFYAVHGTCLAFDQSWFGETKLRQDPIVIYNPVNADSPFYKRQDTNQHFLQSFTPVLLFKMSKDAFLQFGEQNGFDPVRDQVKVTNAYDLYRNNRNLADRSLLVGVVISLLLLFLQGLMVRTLLRLEIQIKSTLFGVQKTLGYSLWRRFRYLFGFFGITYAACSILFLIVFRTNMLFSAAVIAAVFLLELAVTVRFARKTEQENLATILKGGQFG